MNNAKKSTVDTGGYLNEFYCKISINEVEFLPQNIEVLHIKESIFNVVPTLELVFRDDGTFLELFPLQENDEIKVNLSRTNEKDLNISTSFSLQNYNVSNLDGDSQRMCLISLTGFLKLDNFYHPAISKYFKNKSSVDVLKNIATDCGLTSVVRISTSDVMNWMQINQSNFSFMDEVIDGAFKSDDLPLIGITRDKEFIITSLGTESKRTNIAKCFFDPVQALNTNLDDKQKKNVYFNNYDLANIAGFANKMGGYGMSFSQYDLTNNKSFSVGQKAHQFSEYLDKDKTNSKNPSENFGAYVYDQDNVHRNMFQAKAQNYYFAREFFKEGLVLYINPINKVKLFDVLDVQFPSFGAEKKNGEVLSGKYLVGAIFHQASKAGFYRVALTLYRNGFNGSSYLKNYHVVKT